MIAILLADGFEEIEALTPVDVLRRAGLDAKTVAISSKIAVGSHGISTVCDLSADEVNLDEVTAVVFPGGMPGALNLDASDFSDKIIAAVNKNGGIIAAICAAPLVLGRRGLLKGKRATCYPGFENELVGALVSDESVVADGKIVTGRAMGAALEFALKLVELIKGADESKRIADSICMEKSDTVNICYEVDSDSEDESGYLNDQKFLDAVDIAVTKGKISISLLQRKLSIGYGKAAKYIDIMEDMGIISEMNGQKARDVLVTKDEWHEMLIKL